MTALAVQESTLPMLVSGEKAGQAVAASAKAQVEARYLMALQRPRNWNDVRNKLLEACKRPGFADAAKYAKPIGKSKTLVGASIRFAEEAARCMGNLYCPVEVVYDDDKQRIIRVSPTDLEANLTYPLEIVIEKTVERLYVQDGQTILSARTNSQGKTTYLVRASEDEMTMKQLAQASKAMRNGVLRILPQDIIEEALEAVDVTVKEQFAGDREKTIKRLATAFFRQGVSAQQLEAHIGKPLSSINDAEFDLLRGLYNAIKEGETTWRDVVGGKDTNGHTENGEGKEPPKKGVAAIKEHLAKTRKKEAVDPVPKKEPTLPPIAAPGPGVGNFPAVAHPPREPGEETDDMTAAEREFLEGDDA